MAGDEQDERDVRAEQDEREERDRQGGRAEGNRRDARERAALFALEPVAPDDTLRYGDHPDQVVDFHLPARDDEADADLDNTTGAAAKPAPFVVLFHGGFWRSGYDRTYLSPAAAALAGQGMPVALVEYRRTGSGGGWPETFEDASAAIDAAAGHPAAQDRALVVVGHSAGGHLALWVACRPRAADDRSEPADDRSGSTDDGSGAAVDQPVATPAPAPASGPAPAAAPGSASAAGREPDRVGAVAPVADLARAHELGLDDHAVAALLGGTDQVAALLPRTDPARLLPAHIPVTILHGTADQVTPVELSRRYEYAAAAHAARGEDRGAPAPVLRELDGVGHFALVTPGTTPFGELAATLLC